jgi:cyclopropane fatty-acyl-phospholipid synthase-like methyltransferase
MPICGKTALDIGARDGFYSKIMVERFEHVTALDLERPAFAHDGVTCVQGDVTSLGFADGTFDFVFCAEVLEHVAPQLLGQACAELSRVTNGHLLIGVPYRQDIRVGRTTCQNCGRTNPPWGHVNSFDERTLFALFPNLIPAHISFVGRAGNRTNMLSAALMEFAGHPYGTYDQDERCIHCASKLQPPSPRNLAQKVATRLAVTIDRVLNPVARDQKNWIHVLFGKAA